MFYYFSKKKKEKKEKKCITMKIQIKKNSTKSKMNSSRTENRENECIEAAQSCSNVHKSIHKFSFFISYANK